MSLSDDYKNRDKFPKINEISQEMPAVSEYCPVTKLPELYKEANTDTLPVIDIEGKITGIVSEYDLAQIVPDLSLDEKGYQSDIKVADIMTKNVWVETKKTNINNLFNKIHNMHARVVPIIEDNGIYTGNAITRSLVISYLTRLIKPDSLRGLATPFGVYITDGRHQAGVGNFAIFFTGVTIGTILVFVEQLSSLVISYFKIDISNPAIIPVVFFLQLLAFVFVLRLTPLVKMHAAEHQTINAIEKGLPLTLGTVRMQPKEHKRCGTNLMVLLIGIQFVILLFVGYIKEMSALLQFLFLFIGFMFVFSNWRKWGILLQKYFTTVNPPDKYIYSAIKAGEEILQKHKNDLHASAPSFFRKLWCMSIIQIVAGFIFIQWLFNLLFDMLSSIKLT